MPQALLAWMQPFASCFSRPVWRHVLVLVAGSIIAPGRRTVAAALRVMGCDQVPGFAKYHRVLSRDRWSSRTVAHHLLMLLVGVFAATGPIILGLDDTLERRWGAKIKARGIYRDPVRSSHGHFVKASGLRWLSLMLLAPIPWADRVWALPFFTVLAPSERYARQYRLRHKKLTVWARQMLLQAARWLPQRRIIVVADMSYAAIELLNAVCRQVCLIARLRLDARLFEPAPPRTRSTRGRPRVSGRRLPTLAEHLDDPKAKWQRIAVTGWYGRTTRALDILSGTAIWHHPGKHAPIRWVLVRDVAGELAPQAFLCTELNADPVDILRWFVRRWCTEVTFEEVRRHLGVETQRQWSDQAIARTTPALLGLFSLIALGAEALHASAPMTPRPASWYDKRLSTFSDALAAVRRELWNAEIFDRSLLSQDAVEIPRTALERLITAACYPA